MIQKFTVMVGETHDIRPPFYIILILSFYDGSSAEGVFLFDKKISSFLNLTYRVQHDCFFPGRPFRQKPHEPQSTNARNDKNCQSYFAH